MERENILTNRVSPEYVVSKSLYMTGIIDMTEYLFIDLIDLLKAEDRCFGIVKSYIHSMRDAYHKIGVNIDEEDADIFDRMLFLYKPIILKEFDRLKQKRLSPADATITMIHKMLSIVLDQPGEYEYKSELKTLDKVISNLWNNIKNRSKNDALYYFSDLLRTYMEKGSIGRFPLSHINLKEVKEKNPALRNPGIRIKEDSDTKITEINLM